MSTTEIKQELHKYIDIGNDEFVERLYELAKEQMVQLEKDRMIAEAEEDIEMGRTYSQQEMKEYIENWKG